MNLLSKIKAFPGIVITFTKEARQELKKVQWPTRQDTARSTILILAVSLFIAVITGMADYTLTWIVEHILL